MEGRECGYLTEITSFEHVVSRERKPSLNDFFTFVSRDPGIGSCLIPSIAIFQSKQAGRILSMRCSDAKQIQ